MKKFLFASSLFLCAAALLVVPVFGGTGSGNLALVFTGAGLLSLVLIK